MSRRRSYWPALDGLRAIACYLVVLFHSGLAVARGGFIGVDVFFVLSGFLITGLLLDDLSEHGAIRFAAFYARRARRLLLPAVVVGVAICVVYLLIAGVVERLPLIRDAQSALLYVANWRFLSESDNYFATGFAKSPFLHFWSLSVEEQFYAVFPLLILALGRASRRRRWVLPAALAVLSVLSLGAQLYWSARDPNHAYYGTDARAYQLLAGALLACALPRIRKARVTRRAANALTTAGLTGVLILASSLLSVSASTRGVLVTVASVALIGGLVCGAGSRTADVLSTPVPTYLGRISYATYLWHWPVLLVAGDLIVLSPLERAGMAIVVATALAAVSGAVIENPVRRPNILDRLRWTTVATGVSLCGLVAVVFVPALLDSSSRPVVTTVEAQRIARLVAHYRRTPRSGRPARREKVPSTIDWQQVANEDGPEHTCNPAIPQRCIVVAGGRPLVLLVGDSHARMIAPALIRLAREHDFTLALNDQASCPWQADLTNLAMTPEQQAQCTASRSGWYAEGLARLHPDLVILASYARDNVAIYGHSLLRTGRSEETLHQLIRDTTDETLARITGSGARALILRSIYTAKFDPLDCLSQSTYVDQCAVQAPRTPPVSDRYYLSAARRMPDVFTFDINRIVCPSRRVCSPIVDGIPVWRNFNHYTTGILVHLRAEIWSSIVHSGALRPAP